MKKKKPSEQQPADFKNNPFKSLKGLKPLAAPQDAKPAAPRKNVVEKDGDAEKLFLRAVAGARRMEHPSAPAQEPRLPKTPVGSASPQPDDALFLQAMKKIGASFADAPWNEDEEIGNERRSQSSRMKQLKRGAIRITRELDLHGYLRDEALKQLERFIRDAYDSGQQAVLVITGKGINSPEGPVLKAAVESWLRERGKGKVAEFSQAPRDKGGSGAFVVFLKKQNDNEKQHN